MGTSWQLPLQSPQCPLPEGPMDTALGPPLPKPLQGLTQVRAQAPAPSWPLPSVGPSSLLCISAGASPAPGPLAWPFSQQLFPWPGPQVQSTQQLQCTLLSRAPAPQCQPLPKGAQALETASELKGQRWARVRPPGRTGKLRFWRAVGSPALPQASAVGCQSHLVLGPAWEGVPGLAPPSKLSVGPHSL